MKDKELRAALEDSGVVKTVMVRDGGEFLQVLDVEGQLNAICEYLEIKLSRVPERIIAKRKNAPQNTVEAKPEQPNTLRDPIPLHIIRQVFVEIVNMRPDVVDNFIDALVTAAKQHP